ncbi:MAG TPA: Uma2 family endonuclease [Nostocaceae cyanobacterium]|nr:Uma2 family endonuclease [Nostocaceae cyanobacterium]
MVKSIKDKKLTLAEFLALPEEDINYELVDGYVVPKESPKYYHSALQRTLLIILNIWCKGKGRTVAEWAIILTRKGQDWTPLPDVTYISYQRLPKSWKFNQACPVPPELVIEIISPNQTIKEFADKAKDYLAAGVARVWIIDPEAMTIRVFLSPDESQNYTDDTPILDDVLPGFELTVRQLFTEAELI